MSIDEAVVARVATLARIALPAEDRARFAGELAGILQFIEQLSAVDTDGVQPMTSVAAMTLPLRADVVADGGRAEAVTAGAPERAGPFFTVPKVVE